MSANRSTVRHWFSMSVIQSVCKQVSLSAAHLSCQQVCAVWIAQCLISKDVILCFFYSKIFEVEGSHKVNVWSCLSVSCPFNGWFDWGTESLNFFFIPSFADLRNRCLTWIGKILEKKRYTVAQGINQYKPYYNFSAHKNWMNKILP